MLPWLENGSFPLYLAPMAGFTDVVFRELCKREGADVMVSEFVMADSINLGEEFVWETIDFSDDQRPMGVQIFGSRAQSMADAAKRVEERSRPDFIDLNFGCPAEKVTCQDAGASLLRNPKRLIEIAGAVVRAVPGTPVTAKIRIGWDEQSIVAMEVARGLEDAGIRVLTIHGRTKVQGYRGEANWALIRRIAEEIQLPVIGNGNVRSSSQVHDLKCHSRVKGVMIGRGALGYPWIFREIKQHLSTGKPPAPPTLKQRWDTLIDYANLLSSRPLRQNRENRIEWMRPRLTKLTKDMLGCKQLRLELQRIRFVDDLPALAERHIARYQHVEDRIFERNGWT